MHLAKNPKNRMFLLSLLASCMGVLLNKLICLPFAFDICLTILPFVVIGRIFRQMDFFHNIYLKRNLIICFSVWGAGMAFFAATNSEIIDIANRNYSVYPLSFIVAVCGAVLFIYLCKFIGSAKTGLVFAFLGRNSLALMLIHAMDISVFSSLWNFSPNALSCLVCRITIDVILLKSWVSIKSRFYEISN